MDYIKQWTLCVSITLIIAVMLSLITPNGTMGKFYKTVISLFLVVSFLMPIADFDFNGFEIDFSMEESMLESKDTYKTQIENWVKSSLEEGGYNSCSVQAKISLKDDEITINSLDIAVPSKYDLEEIQKYVLEQLGFAAKVRYLGD